MKVNLSEASIRQRATMQVWTRGRTYFDRGLVENAEWRDGVLSATVQGSGYSPYRVRVVGDEHGVISAECTCPYDWGGDCKHIIAVLLHALHTPEAVVERQPLTSLLADLNREQLIELITTIAQEHSNTLTIIDRFTLIPTSPTPHTTTATIDTDMIRRQVRANVRDAVGGDRGYEYDDWYDEGYIGDNLGNVFDGALQVAQAQMLAGNTDNALAVLEAATEAWGDGIDSLDEYVIEELSYGDDAEYTSQLGDMWAEVLLSAAPQGGLPQLTATQRDHWSRRIAKLADSVFAGRSLDIAVSAATDHWDYPPLVAAMQGNITERGAWDSSSPPDYADRLAVIRLRILANHGQIEEYLNLAQAEGQFILYLQMLIEQGQLDKALAEGKTHLTSAHNCLTITKSLAERDAVDHAIELAKHGFTVEHEQGRNELAVWLRDFAQTHKQADVALWAARQAFAESMTLANYLGVETNAETQWRQIKPELLLMVAKETTGWGSADNRVDIYLHEKMYKEAIAIVNSATWFRNIDKVIEAVKNDYPDWAFQQCRKQAEPNMDNGKSQYYDVSAEWLRRGRDILIAAGKDAKWSTYLKTLLIKHHRKYKLMPMLRNLK